MTLDEALQWADESDDAAPALAALAAEVRRQAARASIAEAVRFEFQSMTGEQRLDCRDALMRGYCTGCGDAPDGDCYCQNDD